MVEKEHQFFQFVVDVIYERTLNAYSRNPLIRNHILRNSRLIFLLLAPFYMKPGRLIYDRFLVFFSKIHKPRDTNKQTKCQFES